jgi:hypothetical protein
VIYIPVLLVALLLGTLGLGIILGIWRHVTTDGRTSYRATERKRFMAAAGAEKR